MAYKIEIEPNASNDFIDACNYYNSLPINTENLIYQFTNEFNNALNTLSINPFYAKRYKDYRALAFKKFPYIIFYCVDEVNKLVTIYALFNTHQNPDKFPQ